VVDAVLQQPLAPWWKRLVAIIVDGLVLGFGGTIVLLVIGAAAGTSNNQTPGPPATNGQVAAGVLLASLFITLVGAIYYGALNGSRRGQTVGKLALGIAVRDARSGGPIGFWRAFGRALVVWLFAIFLFIPYVLDSLAPLWDKRRQAWHDKVANSVVIDLKP
jgi:uncharacterized RDD family membrane protein YckC